jgi:hypothetical protein
LLYWRDRYLRFACIASLSLHRGVGDPLREIDGLIAIIWGRGRTG